MAKDASLTKEAAKAKKANEKNSKKTVFNNTVVVLVTLVVSGICVWGLDTLFATLLRLALNMSSAG